MKLQNDAISKKAIRLKKLTSELPTIYKLLRSYQMYNYIFLKK